MTSPAGAAATGSVSARETELQRKIEHKRQEIERKRKAVKRSENDIKGLEKMLQEEKETTSKKRKFQEFMTEPSGSEGEDTYLPSHVDAAISRTKAAIQTLDGNLTWYRYLKTKTDELAAMASTPIPADRFNHWELDVLKALKAWIDSDRIQTTELSGTVALQMGLRLCSMSNKMLRQKQDTPRKKDPLLPPSSELLSSEKG